jgi:cytochrome P450
MSSIYLPVAAACVGVASYIFYFKIGEHWLHVVRYIQAFILVCIAGVFVQSNGGKTPLREAIASTATYASLYLAGIYSSLIIYRLFLNPLNKIPGPYWARLSRFYLVFHVGGTRKLHLYLLEMHKKYGQFVRLDPYGISVTHPDAVEVTMSSRSKCTKSEWYEADHPRMSMHTSRNRVVHDQRRRIWSPAFSDKALRGYENRVQKYNDLLIQRLEESSGKPMDMAKWFNLYSFDVMGDLAFGASYGCLETGDMHWAIQLLSEGMGMLGTWMPNWFFRLLLAIPGAAKDHYRMLNYCDEQLQTRIKLQGKLENNDITHTLIEHYNQNKDEESRRMEMFGLQGDTRLIIIAGSDTTAATLVHLFYHIATQKGLIKRLRDELDSLVKPGQKIENVMIQDAPILNGSINEALRLNPVSILSMATQDRFHGLTTF